MLSDQELDRYQRHIVLKEIGGQGQARLQSASVAVIGAGGLGNPCLQYLAAAGIGRATLIDDDTVGLSNLQRQTLFTTADIGRSKVQVAAERLAALNPHVVLNPVARRLTPDNAATLLAGHDIIADGCDTFATRALVNRSAVALGIPLVSAAIGPFEGQLGVFAGHLADQPCWACFAGAPADIPGNSCADIGVLGAVAGLIGSAQALEVLRLVTGFGEPQLGRLWLYEGLSLATRSIRVPKDPACPVCS
ncbi:HesA/MoeB/ThiF family protein [Sandaracinobacteroides hominis]|uniref:HesA/MoeB/ThiF family protein n=1 Tax=Sandaracinobacteroides hominis TaxID=2780086 RepID=UPI0018F3E971|nr:molybdopterin-synthase adenylyltransferase MoeB [Sandaracinobacteroides hominis]